ncbi:MAG TPA: hypothetical protein VMC41_01055 [Candidatus Nanoarchaeia archaeon]|nr:hypothetical protein [Candidatus Nanoarchaeia archaeon]
MSKLLKLSSSTSMVTVMIMLFAGSTMVFGFGSKKEAPKDTIAVASPNPTNVIALDTVQRIVEETVVSPNAKLQTIQIGKTNTYLNPPDFKNKILGFSTTLLKYVLITNVSGKIKGHPFLIDYDLRVIGGDTVCDTIKMEK